MLALAALTLAPAARADGAIARLSLTDTDGYFTIQASIEGVAVSLLVDTGADTGVILPETARALRLRRDPGRSTRMQGTGGDGAQAPHALLGEVRLGALVVTGASLPVAPLPAYPRLSPPVAGLLGGDFLSAFTVEIAVADRQMTLRRNLHHAEPTPDGLPAERSGNRLLIPARLDGLMLRALVDSGSRSILLGERAALRLGVTPAMLAADPGGVTSGVDLRPSTFHWHRFARLEIGKEVQRDVTLTVAPLDDSADLLLGAPFFVGRRVVLDYGAGVVSVG